MTAAFDLNIPAEYAAQLEPLHPSGERRAAVAALRLYLDLGKEGVDALQDKAAQLGLSTADTIKALLAQPEPTTITPTKRPNYRHSNNAARDKAIAEEYFTGTTTYPRLAAKYKLSTIRITQIVSRARALADAKPV